MVKKGILFSLVLMLLLSTSVFALNTTEALKQKISSNFVDTSMERVIRVLANQYGLNIIISGSAKGKVTIQLTNVPLGDALNAILKTQGYHYVSIEDVLYVKPLKDEVNGDLQSKVFVLKYMDGFQLKNSLKPMLSAKGKMEALLSEPLENEKYQRSHVLVVSDYWENIGQISTVIKEMDKPEQQLQIEVRLVEKLVGDEKRVGLDLPKSLSVSLQGAETNAPITKSDQSGGDPTILSAWYQLPDQVQDLNIGILTFDQFKATLDILATDANSSLVSKPSVTTLNNKQALIKIGQNIPIAEVSRGVGGDLITYKEKEVSMALKVTPHIGLNGDITLDVHPVLEEIIGYTGSSEAPQPITSKREVKTTVMVKDGQTLVIGGLIKESKTENVSKVWLLGDIPILGYLFKHTTMTTQKNDLLIFITTKIITPRTN